jgi:hypothetical protein
MSELTWRATYTWSIKNWSTKRERERLLLETVSINGRNW